MDKPNSEENGQEHMDYQEHQQTYKLFITLTQWGSAIAAIVLILMALFLV